MRARVDMFDAVRRSDRVLIDRSLPLLPPGAGVQQVLVCRTGPYPLALPVAAVAWAAVSLLVGTTLTGAWILLITGPCFLVYLVHLLKTTRFRVVWVTGEASFVVGVSRVGTTGSKLLTTLPPERRLGPVRGLWGRTSTGGELGPIEGLWGHMRLGQEKVWVHRRFHGRVRAADATRPSAVGAETVSSDETRAHPEGARRWRPPRAVAAPALLIAGGAAVALLAVVRASAAVLAVACVLLLAGIVVTAVRARRLLPGRGQKVAVVVGVLALAAAILAPASMNVDPCARIGRGADLSGCDLSGRVLTAENLHGADLRDADLSDSDLSGVDLGGADLRGTRLRGADLTATDLTGARVRDADLRDALLSRARWPEATMRGADLRGSRLAGATLTGSDFSGARVEGAVFTDAVVSDAVLADLDLSDGDLTGAVLDGADLSGTDLTGAQLAGADLSEADLSGANLSGAHLAAARDAGSERSFRPADLDRADLRGANLSGADLTGVAAPGATFDDADFTGTRLLDNDFVGSHGIKTDDLGAAFEVPGRRVPGEAARRGVVLHTYEEIVEVVTPVRDGRAVPAVQPYVASDEFHPAIVFDDTVLLPGAPSWADAVRHLWAPTVIRYAELVVVASRSRESIETCPYTYADTGGSAPPTIRYVITVTVTVRRAHDAGIVDERTFRGGDPAPCPFTKLVTLGGFEEIEGSPPDVGALARPWLDDLINAPAEQRELG